MTVHRQVARPFVTLWPDNFESAIDLTPILLSFQASKQMGAPMGQWSLTIQPSLQPRSRRLLDYDDFTQRLAPHSVVSIGYHATGGVMVGLVTGVSRSQGMGGGVSDRITITGNDFGMVLANDHIVSSLNTVPRQDEFVREIQKVVPDSSLIRIMVNGVWGPTRGDGARIFDQATLQEVFSWLVVNVPSVRIPLLSGIRGERSARFGDFVQYDIMPSWNDARIQAFNPNTVSGSVWEMINQFVDHDFYEVYLDTLGMPLRYVSSVSTITGEAMNLETGAEVRVAEKAKKEVTVTSVGRGQVLDYLPNCVLYVRPKPFDEPERLDFLPANTIPELTWQSLRTRRGHDHHIITPDQVLNHSFSVSAEDVFSYYTVTSPFDILSNPQNEALGLFFPAVDLYILAHHGVRAYQSQIKLMGSQLDQARINDPAFTKTKANEILQFRNRLVNWYRLNGYFESGSITVVGHDDYRIGEPVYLPWRAPMRGDANRPGMRYYCVGTTHSWQFGGVYTTTLQLTRGHNTALIEYAKAHIAEEGKKYGNESMLVAT